MATNDVVLETLTEKIQRQDRFIAEPHQDETPEKNYGADINTLIRLLEDGRL